MGIAVLVGPARGWNVIVLAIRDARHLSGAHVLQPFQPCRTLVEYVEKLVGQLLEQVQCDCLVDVLEPVLALGRLGDLKENVDVKGHC